MEGVRYIELKPMEVIDATPDSFEFVLPLLRYFESGTPHLTAEHWRRLFHYTWEPPGETRGFLLLDKNRVVGFEAFINHRRWIDGKEAWIANGSSWVVLPEYRRFAILLKEPWMRLHREHPELCSTGLSAKKGLDLNAVSRTGAVLDSHYYIMYPTPEGSGLLWQASNDPEVLWNRLGDEERRLYLDHQCLPCDHTVLWRGDEVCYVVSVRRSGPKGFSAANIMYVSSAHLFRRAIDRIKLALFQKTGAVWLTVDERFLGSWQPHFGRRVPFTVPKTLASSTLAPAQIDNLYSEQILLEI
jgi:hypothetical protein